MTNVMLLDVIKKLAQGRTRNWLDFYMEANGYESKERKEIWLSLK